MLLLSVVSVVVVSKFQLDALSIGSFPSEKAWAQCGSPAAASLHRFLGSITARLPH
jgi:hypothetical protein